SARMRCKTAVRRRLTEATAIERADRRAFRQVNPGVVGLAGLEPAASSLSAIGGLPLCNPAFLQVAADRQGRSNAVLATSFEAVQARGLCTRSSKGSRIVDRGAL